jgi:hypothetical protein
MLLDTSQCEAPVTTWPPLDEELTPLDDCRPPTELEGLEELAGLSEVEELEGLGEESTVEAELAVPVVAVALDDEPGMVAALTALKTPTAATAANAAPTVSRFSSRRAASRARMRFSACVFSMVDSLRLAARPNVGEG